LLISFGLIIMQKKKEATSRSLNAIDIDVTKGAFDRSHPESEIISGGDQRCRLGSV
jgi:hypothetical protein